MSTFRNFLEFSPPPRTAQVCQAVIRYSGSERDVGVVTNFRGQVQSCGLMTCVSVAVLFASRRLRPIEGRVSGRKVFLRYGKGVIYVIGTISVSVVDFKFGL
jgi:hypothetical protein